MNLTWQGRESICYEKKQKLQKWKSHKMEISLLLGKIGRCRGTIFF